MRLPQSHIFDVAKDLAVKVVVDKVCDSAEAQDGAVVHISVIPLSE